MKWILKFWQSKHWLVTLLRMLVLGYAAVHVLAFFFAPMGMFPRSAIGEAYKPGEQTFFLETRDGLAIAAEYHPVTNALATILFSHGNAELMHQNRWAYRDWNRLGCSVLAYDYRGYGMSEGRPGEAGVKRDIEAAWDWLTRIKGIEPSSVLVYGRSIGGGPSVWLAERHSVGGLVLESSFRSVGRVPFGRRILLFDWFSSQDLIADIDCPLLLLHGEEDTVIASSHSVELHRRAEEPKKLVLVERAGHNNLHQYIDDVYEPALSWILGQINRP